MLLLLGATGCLGSAFQEELTRRGMDYLGLSRVHADYTNPQILERLIRELRPSFLINCAGFTGKPNVDACEQFKSECLAANAVLPGTIRNVCEHLGVPWGHVSSGCIFSGCKENGTGYSETDTPNFTFRSSNCSWYSGCKQLGEECLYGATNVYVWRLRMPFWNLDSPRNYLSKVMSYSRLLNVENSLTKLDEFVNACLECLNLQAPFGTYNITNGGSITTERITYLVEKYVCPGKKFKFFHDEAEFLKTVAAPRSSCVLDNGKLQGEGIFMSDVEDAVIDCLVNWNNSKATLERVSQAYQERTLNFRKFGPK